VIHIQQRSDDVMDGVLVSYPPQQKRFLPHLF